MTDFLVCIGCLSSDIRMCCISNTNTELLEIYEKLTHIVLSNEVGIPKTMCYICYTQLQKCCQFMNMAKRAGQILLRLLSDGGQITKETISTIDKTSFNNFVTTVLKPTNVPSRNNFIEETAQSCNDEDYATDAQPTEILVKEHKKGDELMIIEEELITIKEEPVAIKLELTAEEEHTSEEQKFKKVKKVTAKLEPAKTHQADDSSVKAPNDDLLKPKRKYTKKKDKNSKPNMKTHACNSCDMKFSCHAYLIRHLRVHTGEKPFSCKSCVKTFAQNSHLVQHMRLHTGEKPFTCHICNKAFNHRYNYKTHMRKHFGVPSHTCDLCNSAFHQKADLKRHIMSHTGEKPYTCTTCNVKFSQNCHLTKHMRLHDIKKPYSCTTCGLNFTMKNDYKNHLMIHPENTQYLCSVEGCSMWFNRKSTLTNHIKSHKEEKPYACDKCVETFKQKSHLLKHVRMVHDKTLQHDLQSNETDIQINPPIYSNLFTNEPLLNQGVLQLQDDVLRNHYLLQEHVEEYIIP